MRVSNSLSVLPFALAGAIGASGQNTPVLRRSSFAVFLPPTLVTVQAAGQLELCSDGLVSSQETLHALSLAFDIDTIFPKSKLRTDVL